MKIGLFDECIADCDLAKSIDPFFPKSYYRKAMAQLSMNDLPAALETLKVGLEMCPDNEDLQKMQ